MEILIDRFKNISMSVNALNSVSSWLCVKSYLSNWVVIFLIKV